MKANLTESAVPETPLPVPSRNQSLFVPERASTPLEIRRFPHDPSGVFAVLKERVAAALERDFATTIGPRFVRQIVNEATALAATTSFPALVLPALAEEKARNAS